MSTSDKIFDCIPVMRSLAQSFLDGITDSESGEEQPSWDSLTSQQRLVFNNNEQSFELLKEVVLTPLHF